MANEISKELQQRLLANSLAFYPYGLFNTAVVYKADPETATSEDDDETPDPELHCQMIYYRDLGKAYDSHNNLYHCNSAEDAIHQIFNL